MSQQNDKIFEKFMVLLAKKMIVRADNRLPFNDLVTASELETIRAYFNGDNVLTTLLTQGRSNC